MLLHTKQASEPSPKIIIVATHTHDSNGGHGIAMLHLVTNPWPSHALSGCLRFGENGVIWMLSLCHKPCCCISSKPQNPLQSSSLLPHIPMTAMEDMG